MGLKPGNGLGEHGDCCKGDFENSRKGEIQAFTHMHFGSSWLTCRKMCSSGSLHLENDYKLIQVNQFEWIWAFYCDINQLLVYLKTEVFSLQSLSGKYYEAALDDQGLYM